MKSFSLSDFRALGVCRSGLVRVAAFGGAIENTAAGWQAYINANPDAWRAPLFTAWRLHKRGDISCPDLIWRVARIAFREQPDRNATLRQYGETLGPDNWREARSAAYAAYAAAAAYADNASTRLLSTPQSWRGSVVMRPPWSIPNGKPPCNWPTKPRRSSLRRRRASKI